MKRRAQAVVSVFIGLLLLSTARSFAGDYTQQDYFREMLAFDRAELVDAYQKVGRHDPKWDTAATAALETLSLYDAENAADEVAAIGLYAEARIGETELRDAAQKAIDLGCDDPMVLYARALAPINEGRSKEGRDWLTKAEANLAGTSYSPIRQARLVNRLRRICDDEDKKDQLWSNCLKLCEEMGRQKFMNSAARRESAHTIAFIMESVDPQIAEGAIAQLASAAGVDDWVSDIVTAEVEVGLAYEIAGRTSDEQAAAYQRYMSKAGDAAAKAYRLDPSFPEEATIMIDATGAGDAMKWLDRAREAQSDYAPAFNAYFTAMQWGGSAEKCMDVGKQAADTRRFDTSIPWEYLIAVESFARVTDVSKTPFKDPQIRQTATDILNQYITLEKQAKRLEYFKACLAALDAVNGQMPEAKNLLDQIPGDPDPNAFRLFNVWAPLSIDDVYLSTMPDAADIANFRRASGRRIYRNAEKFLQAVIDKDHPAGRASEILDRLKNGAQLMVAFNKNQPVSLMDEKSRGLWESETPYKIVDGAITTLAGEAFMIRSRYMFEDRHYTVHLEMDFDDIAATHGQVLSLAWGQNPSLANPVGWSLTLTPEQQSVLAQAPISANEDADKKFSMTLAAKNVIDITYWDDGCAVKINGTDIDMDFGNHSAIAAMKPPNRLYVSSNAAVRIEQFTIQHLTKKP